MKTLWALVLGITALGAFEYGLKPVRVTPEVYCYFGAPEVMDTRNNGNMVNSCFVDTGSHWLVIDSGPTYMYAKEALLHVKQIKPMDAAWVIDTHVHDDHWLGNGFYAAQGAEIIGSNYFTKVIHSNTTPRMARRISQEAYEHTVPTAPAHLLRQSTRFSYDQIEVEVVHVDHKAHTDGDLFVYIPKYQVLFAGDLVFNDRIPSLHDGDINGWIEALEQLRALHVKHIVGGHGTAYDANATNFTYNYLTQLRAEIRNAIEEGRSIDEAVNSVVMAPYQKFALYNIVHRKNVETAYRMLEWEDE